MSIQRYTRPIDGTIPVSALLYDDEDGLASQDGVGIYDGPQKSPNHQNGTVYVTSHRIFYIDAMKPHSRSFAFDLSLVSRTEYYAGLFTSSSKVTLHISPPDASRTDPVIDSGSAGDSWICEVCNFRNPPGQSPTTAKCTLCGVPRAKSSISASASASASASSPIPSNTTSGGVSAAASPRPFSVASTLLHSASVPVSPTPTPAPVSAPATSEVSCPACTFLNHPSLRKCEICGTALPKAALVPGSSLFLKSAPVSRPVSPAGQLQEGEDSKMLKLSFRKGGDKVLYAVLKRSLLGKAWETKDVGAASTSTNGAERSGIHGLLRTVETSAKARQTDMDDALQDLEALMIKARDMVKLAGDLNERLTATSSLASNPYSSSALSSMSTADGISPEQTTSFSSSATLIPSTEPEEATFIRSSLAQLGLQMQNTPVTLDMIRDEKKWHEELARELSGILQGTGGKGGATGIMGERGIIGLDEVWGSWNRARGIALVPPSTFLQVIPHLPQHTTPSIHMRTFHSTGLSVLHTPTYSPSIFVERLSSMITEKGPRTSLEVAWAENVPVGLVAEMIGEAELDGKFCRDEVQGKIGVSPTAAGGGTGGGGGGELRWWLNVFSGYVWDGQE